MPHLTQPQNVIQTRLNFVIYQAPKNGFPRDDFCSKGNHQLLSNEDDGRALQLLRLGTVAGRTYNLESAATIAIDSPKDDKSLTMTVDTLSLAGKVAIITGSGRENGIGAGIAFTLTRNGAAVTINHVSDSTAPRAKAIAEKIRAEGGKAIAIQAFVDLEGAKKLVEETLKAFGTGKIDILVNNAAFKMTPPSTTIAQTPTTMESIFRSFPHMPPGGRVINISSIASKLGMVEIPFYGATKAAMDSLTFAWAGEFGKSHSITVNSIAPGPVITDLIASAIGDTESARANQAAMVGAARAEARVGTPQDIADAVLLLVSEKARWITGQFISVSGGITGG